MYTNHDCKVDKGILAEFFFSPFALREFISVPPYHNISNGPPLSDFLSRSQYLHSVMALTASELDLKKNQKRLDASVMALEALRNVIKNNAGIT